MKKIFWGNKSLKPGKFVTLKKREEEEETKKKGLSSQNTREVVLRIPALKAW